MLLWAISRKLRYRARSVKQASPCRQQLATYDNFTKRLWSLDRLDYSIFSTRRVGSLFFAEQRPEGSP